MGNLMYAHSALLDLFIVMHWHKCENIIFRENEKKKIVGKEWRKSEEEIGKFWDTERE